MKIIYYDIFKQELKLKIKILFAYFIQTCVIYDFNTEYLIRVTIINKINFVITRRL